MLMGFTVLQKTDGSFSFGPAFVKDLNIKEADVEAGATELGKAKGLQYRALYEHWLWRIFVDGYCHHMFYTLYQWVSWQMNLQID